MTASCTKRAEEPAVIQTAPAVVEPAAAPSPVLVFVAQAAPGQSTRVVDPYFGGEAEVALGQEYTSASGKTCRQFTVRKPRLQEPGERYFACNDGIAWHMAGVY